MDVTIKISDEQLEKLFNGALEELSTEQKQDILLSAFKEWLSKTNAMESMFVKKDYYSITPTYLTKELLEKCITEKDLNDIKQPIIDLLKEKHKDLVIAALSEIILQNVANSVAIQGAFETYANNLKADIMHELNK